jgi:hypothetical protein
MTTMGWIRDVYPVGRAARARRRIETDGVYACVALDDA